MLYLRGLLQPLMERRALRDMDTLRESIRIAESASESETMDPVLGVAARALPAEERTQAPSPLA
jgi:hypothetical protein